MSVVTIEAQGRMTPPDWAIKQRHLIHLMNRGARSFVKKYTRPDGTLIWRDEWPGMDGSDDGYESFLSFPLFYILGGDEYVHHQGRKAFNAVTWQFTQYGQVHREFDAYYDWMHHGEAYTYLYYLAMSDPNHFMDKQRSLNFVAMYNGEDPEAPNWDPELKMIRSPINGSKGPQFHMSAEDWETHRWVLANYLSPYEDVPGFDASDPMCKLDWQDDAVFAEILKRMNERMVPGDVPLNLVATSLITSAFLYTGEEKYRQWVVDYLQMWMDKTEENGGILPDNIGPSGKIGERMDGKWWGGYYGWRWPHGARKLLETTLIAGSNAVLLTGDMKWLDLHRNLADKLWEMRKEEDGKVVVPNRHGDAGWFHYVPPDPQYYVHLYHISRSDEDLKRLEERLPGWEKWRSVPSFSKAGYHPPLAWHAYHQGQNEGFVETALDATYQGISDRLDKIDHDDDDVDSWDVHHWQNLNPVIPEGIIQIAMGTPAAVYHGGHLHATVRYFDADKRRPGLPAFVSACVTQVTGDSVSVHLVNTDALHGKHVLIQSGGFAEHTFTDVVVGDTRQEVNDTVLKVVLKPGAEVKLILGLKRYVNTPTYNMPSFER
jgi:hypothetical protein